MIADGAGAMTGHNGDVPDTQAQQDRDHSCQDGIAAHQQKRLVAVFGQRPQAPAKARRQNDGVHAKRPMPVKMPHGYWRKPPPV